MHSTYLYTFIIVIKCVSKASVERRVVSSLLASLKTADNESSLAFYILFSQVILLCLWFYLTLLVFQKDLSDTCIDCYGYTICINLYFKRNIYNSINLGVSDFTLYLNAIGHYVVLLLYRLKI